MEKKAHPHRPMARVVLHKTDVGEGLIPSRPWIPSWLGAEGYKTPPYENHKRTKFSGFEGVTPKA